MSCSIPDFINDIPTIAPLPAFPIVCATSFPPALTIPDIPLPPCIDGLSFTSSGISVTVNTGSGYTNTATSSSSFNITEGTCSFDFGGVIVINLPDVAFSPGGLSIDPTCASMDQQDVNPYTIMVNVASSNVDGSWAVANIRVRGGRYQSTAAGTWFTELSGDKTAISLNLTDVAYKQSHNVYLAIPWETTSATDGTLMTNGEYMKPKTGGKLGLTKCTHPTFPTLVDNVTLGYVTYTFIGSWTIKMAYDSVSAKWINRIVVDQKVEQDVTI